MNLQELIGDARLVLMCGISGSGKTVFARHLEDIGYVRLSVDELIWDEFGDSFASMPFSEQQPIFQSINIELSGHLERLLAEGHKVVVDATMCKRAKRDCICALASKYGVKPLLVYLKAPLSVLLRRLAGRKGLGPNDQIVPFEQLKGFYANFEAPGDDENYIQIIQE